MADNKGNYGDDEEIQGAPPVVSRAELREKRLSETITLNRYLYQQTQQFEHMLLNAPDLQSLLEVLLSACHGITRCVYRSCGCTIPKRCWRV